METMDALCAAISFAGSKVLISLAAPKTHPLLLVCKPCRANGLPPSGQIRLKQAENGQKLLKYNGLLKGERLTKTLPTSYKDGPR